MLTIFPDRSETIEGVGEALRAGKASCVAVLQKCLKRIEEWESKVKAWVVIDREGALGQARLLDEELACGKCRGPLHGIPIGIKDIIDVKGLPTACGFEPWRNRVAEKDARAVNSLRDSGAVILGKTVTTQFAWIDPAVTRNPWNLERTPGGSSSGSAAAVATGMCLAALGTQTGGSVIRPASFCGVVGYKFKHEDQLMTGIHPFAITLDHLGIFARTARDVARVAACVQMSSPMRSALKKELGDIPTLSEQLGLIDRLEPLEESSRSVLKLVRLRGFFDRRADLESLDATDRATKILAEAGADVAEVDDPDFDFEGIVRQHRLIMAVQAAVVHESLFRDDSSGYAPHIKSLIEEGLAQKVTEYAREREVIADRRSCVVESLIGETHAILTPATIGPAPDSGTTGNPCMNSPWSYFGLPVIALPVGLSREGLPLSIQLTGPFRFEWEDDLFRTAAWCESAIRRAQGAGSD